MNIKEMVESTGKFCMGAVVISSIGACAGYTFGIITNGNPLLAAQAIAIGTLASFVIDSFIEHGFKDSDDSTKNLLHIAAIQFGGATFTSALKQLEIISKIGATVLGVFIVSISVISLWGQYEGEYLWA